MVVEFAEDVELLVADASQLLHEVPEGNACVVTLVAPDAAAVVGGLEHLGNGGPAEEGQVHALLHVDQVRHLLMDGPLLGVGGPVVLVTGEVAHGPGKVGGGGAEPGNQLCAVFRSEAHAT